ncbi:hypothetical protein J1N35_024915 [Gossypium stocksii]|uniref:Uncharacterized protein n=1 Tax=Gossypium stocksii TaxID=47602 RepID=A0A9D3ZWP2_9ROSI|nr:hypothetical protein J1N35_024915 [Gossypium stocksii]
MCWERFPREMVETAIFQLESLGWLAWLPPNYQIALAIYMELPLDRFVLANTVRVVLHNWLWGPVIARAGQGSCRESQWYGMTGYILGTLSVPAKFILGRDGKLVEYESVRVVASATAISLDLLTEMLVDHQTRQMDFISLCLCRQILFNSKIVLPNKPRILVEVIMRCNKILEVKRMDVVFSTIIGTLINRMSKAIIKVIVINKITEVVIKGVMVIQVVEVIKEEKVIPNTIIGHSVNQKYFYRFN